LVKYGKEPTFTGVRSQIDLQNRQLLSTIIRGAGQYTADQMEKCLENVKSLYNIELKPKPLVTIVEKPMIEEVKAIEEPKIEESKEIVLVEESKEEPKVEESKEEPKVEESKEAVVVEENKEETTEVAEVAEQVNPSTVITADAAPEEQNHEDQVSDDKHEVQINEDAVSV